MTSRFSTMFSTTRAASEKLCLSVDIWMRIYIASSDAHINRFYLLSLTLSHIIDKSTRLVAGSRTHGLWQVLGHLLDRCCDSLYNNLCMYEIAWEQNRM